MRLDEATLALNGRCPDDLDTTSLALMTLKPHPELAASLLNEMAEYVNPDGHFQVSI